METSSGWVWDATRRQYYRYSQADGCIIFQDGTRIPIASGSTSRDRTRSDSGFSGTSSTGQNQLTSAFAALNVGSGSAPGSSSVAYGGRALPQQSAYAGPSNQPAARTNDFNITRDDTGRSTTDPVLLGRNVRAFVRVGATPGEKEKLDKRYRVKSSPRDFFVRGRVFRILWPEPAGHGDQASVYSQGAFNESYHMKVRWFVVIRAGSSFSSCLPINTYGGKGVEKRICVKDEHSIIYTGSRAPKPTFGERARPGEDGMHGPIRVKAKSRSERLDEMSRINYAKVYTVEHNVKVWEFGDVDKSNVRQLLKNFKAVWKVDEDDVDDDIEEEDEDDEDDDDDDEEGDDDDDDNDPSTDPAQVQKHNTLVAHFVASYRANGFNDLADWLQAAPFAGQREHIEQAVLQQQKQQQSQSRR